MALNGGLIETSHTVGFQIKTCIGATDVHLQAHSFRSRGAGTFTTLKTQLNKLLLQWVGNLIRPLLKSVKSLWVQSMEQINGSVVRVQMLGILCTS